MKAIKLLLFGLFLGMIGAAAWLCLDLYQFSMKPTSQDDAQMVFEIQPGENFDHLSARLQSRGLINDTDRFKMLARLKGADKKLKAGEYRLTAVMTPVQLLDTLVEGKVFLYALTVPEGFTLHQIARELDRTQLTNAAEFERLATDPQTAGAFGLAGKTLEGYLFPDTYYFPKAVAPQTVITKMVAHFKQQFSEEWYQRAEQLGMSLHEVVTLASIIEKETGEPSERRLISSVFHNRLKKKMRLASDPTVIYGIKDFDGNLTRKHLTTRTDYNTYIIKGLPPGPIANPGRLALEAALYPEKTDYLYFVSKRDGTHYFSTNFKEHNRAVRKYQLRR